MFEISQERLALLDSAVLKRGCHPGGDETCARELIYLIITGKHLDKTPDCLTVALSVLPILNDGPWNDDKHRTRVMIPWIRKLLQCERNAEIDQRIAYKLAYLAIREFTSEALDAASLGDEAEKLRTLPAAVDHDTWKATRVALDAAMWSARAATSDAAVVAAMWSARRATAASSVAKAAVDAVDAAMVSASALAVSSVAKAAVYAVWEVVTMEASLERHTNRILAVICEEYGVQ